MCLRKILNSSGSLINAIAFAVLVIVLVVRPSGLLGRPFYEARLEVE